MIKGPGGKGVFIPTAKGLDHGNHKVLVGVARPLLDATYGGTRTELLDAIPPLIGQELLVNDDEGPEFQVCRKSQGDGGFPKSGWKREDASTELLEGFDSCRKSLWLSGFGS